MNSNMKVTTGDVLNQEANRNFTLKVLFGPMYGCELHLPADDYFFIINPGLSLHDDSGSDSREHAAQYTQKVLYIPCDMPSPNILLRLSQPIEDEKNNNVYRLEVQDVSGSYLADLHENEIFSHGHIRFAFKRSEDEWPEEIQNFNLPREPEPALFYKNTIRSFYARKHRSLFISSIILIILIAIASLIWYEKLEKDRQIYSLSEALAGSPSPLEIVKSRDGGMIFVLARNFPQMEWVQEALIKFKENKNVTPVWLKKKNAEVIAQLIKLGFPILQLDSTTPQHPVVAVYQKLSDAEEQKLKAAVLQKIVFARDITIIVKTKIQLLNEARQGLDRLHIPYRQINTTTGYALVVRDALSDSVLSALRHFIKNYEHQWGNSVINFSINLDEDWLQNKSYLDSSNGYLFLNPRHWYFPLKQRDINYE